MKKSNEKEMSPRFLVPNVGFGGKSERVARVILGQAPYYITNAP